MVEKISEYTLRHPDRLQSTTFQYVFNSSPFLTSLFTSKFIPIAFLYMNQVVYTYDDEFRYTYSHRYDIKDIVYIFPKNLRVINPKNDFKNILLGSRGRLGMFFYPTKNMYFYVGKELIYTYVDSELKVLYVSGVEYDFFDKTLTDNIVNYFYHSDYFDTLYSKLQNVKDRKTYIDYEFLTNPLYSDALYYLKKYVFDALKSDKYETLLLQDLTNKLFKPLKLSIKSSDISSFLGLLRNPDGLKSLIAKQTVEVAYNSSPITPIVEEPVEEPVEEIIDLDFSRYVTIDVATTSETVETVGFESEYDEFFEIENDNQLVNPSEVEEVVEEMSIIDELNSHFPNFNNSLINTVLPPITANEFADAEEQIQNVNFNDSPLINDIFLEFEELPVTTEVSTDSEEEIQVFELVDDAPSTTLAYGFVNDESRILNYDRN